MVATNSRAKYPQGNEGQPEEPRFVRLVDANGNDLAPSYSATLPTLTDGTPGGLQLGTRGSLSIQIKGVDGAGGVSVQASNADGGAVSGSNDILGLGKIYNGTTVDRMRGDTNGISVQSGLSSTFWNYAAATGGIVNTTTAVTIKTAAGATVRNYLKTLTLSHDALGAATEIAVRDGAAGTVLWRGRLQTAATDSSGGAGSIVFDPPLRGTANTLMEAVTLTAVTGGVYVGATGYTGS